MPFLLRGLGPINSIGVKTQTLGHFLVLMIYFFSGGICRASQPALSLVATTITQFNLASDASAFVQYRVTNNTQKTRTLSMTPISGITQVTTGSGYCKATFTLTNRQSCLLTFIADGSQMASTIHGGPEVCRTQTGGDFSDSFSCAQPEQDQLSITLIKAAAEQKAYISNWSGNSISLCDVNNEDGHLQNCTTSARGNVFSSPEAIALNPSATYLYVANISGPASFCAVNRNTGALSNCQTTGSLLSGEDGVAINPAGTLAYFSDFNNNNVSYCQINCATGALSNCVATGNSFSSPSDMTLNRLGEVAYITNLGNSVSVCQVDGGTGDIDCPDKIFNFDEPEGVAIHPSGLFAYITNNGNNRIVYCTIQPQNGLLTGCAPTEGTFDGFGNLAFNRTGTRAYVPNFEANRIDLCDVNLKTGALLNCRDSLGKGFNGPSGVLIH